MNADERFFDAVRERYSFANWQRGSDAGRGMFPRLDGVAGWRFERRAPFEGKARMYTDYYEGEGEARIAVTIDGYDTAADAHEALIAFLAKSMAPRLPSCNELGFRAGDVCFCSFGPDPDKVFFVRHSTFVRVENTGRQSVPVAELAEAIDRQLS